MYLTLLIIISEIGISFAMLTGYRLTIGQTPWQPSRSYCDYCHRQLDWWQLIPVIGFPIQRGRCHFCHHPISPFLWCGELAGAMAVYSLANYQLVHDLELVAFILSLVFLSTTDYYAQLIYCVALLPVCLLIPLTMSCWFHLSWQCLLIVLTTAGFLFILSNGLGGLGGGDVEFIMVVLLITGPLKVAMTVLVASVLMLIWWLSQGESRQYRMPFFPALAIATCLMIP